MDEAERSRRCQEKLDRGELPRLVVPDRILITRGTGGHCALCDDAIFEESTEYELQFLVQLECGRSELISFRLHRPCYHTWLIESGS
jgi:hypothetical protein